LLSINRIAFSLIRFAKVTSKNVFRKELENNLHLEIAYGKMKSIEYLRP